VLDMTPDTARREPICVDALIPPYGGVLVCPLVREGREEALARARSLPSLQISDRAACDLGMLACGAFSPIGSFMGRRDYECVLHDMRLADGTLFPMPITLPISNDTRVPSTEEIALRDAHNVVLAIMRIATCTSGTTKRRVSR
jgi:sulfate adenylyltransferase